MYRRVGHDVLVNQLMALVHIVDGGRYQQEHGRECAVDEIHQRVTGDAFSHCAANLLVVSCPAR